MSMGTSHEHDYHYQQWIARWPSVGADGKVSASSVEGKILVICRGCGEARVAVVSEALQESERTPPMAAPEG